MEAFGFPLGSSSSPTDNTVLKFEICAAYTNASVQTDVPFPFDYSELLEQDGVAVELAMKDNKKLMEIEFPTAGLTSVPGGIEMTGSMQLIREFCDSFISSEKTTRTRIVIFSI
ncbi:unnamed protein product [Vicia faba]|uniref:Uncharacterized protein n=1 Tax=Vicia faba TaxID=3906 RepID=A0AAV0ZP13_VICFA|nr:unnamed protein product [Vicia faba]